VWHCHILGHEENDFMRPMVLNVATTKPAAPTLLKSNLFAANRGDFSWTDNSTDETGFAVQRRVHGSGAPFVTIGTTVPNDYTFSDFTVDPAIGYDYRVIAYNQAGESAPSNLAYINLPMTRMSGTVTTFNGVAIVPKAGVTITASTGEVAVSDASGNYSIDLGAPYTGTLTATLAGFRFSPAARSYTSAAVNQTAQDFTAIPVITISGQVTLNAAALSGVTMTFSSGQTTTSDASGSYTMTLDGPWTGTVVPSLVGYFFSPAATSYALVSTNQIQNYTATVAYTVSGTVYSGLIAGGANGPGLANVTVNLAGAAGNFTATTNASGAYSVYVPRGWTGTITPVLAGTSFTPGNRSLTNVVANTAAQNFTVAYTLTVSAFNAAAPLNLVAVTFTGATGFSTTAALTNATGLTSVVLPKGWTGTVTPFALLRTFSPANATVTALAANRTQYFNTTTRTIVGTTKRVVGNGNVGAVTLTYTGATGFPSGTAASAANSNYTITVPYGWTGTVAASGGTLTTWHYLTSTGAATATYTNVTANQTAQAWLGQ